MSVGPGDAVTMTGRFAHTAPCTDATCLAPDAFTWVRGYPSVSYGLNQCHAATSPASSPRLALPLRLDAIPPHLVGVTSYSTQLSQVTYDVTYDLWLHPTGTRRPCRSEGTLEILVWTDYNARALLPAGMRIGTATIPFAVGHVAHLGTQGWAVYASNIDRAGRTAPWGGTLWFVPGQTDRVSSGRVRVDLSAVFAAAERILTDVYAWPAPARHYWLDTAAFGLEYGPASGAPYGSGAARFSAQLSAYCLDVRSTLLNAPCG
jgi:hypothetical protein